MKKLTSVTLATLVATNTVFTVIPNTVFAKENTEIVSKVEKKNAEPVKNNKKTLGTLNDLFGSIASDVDWEISEVDSYTPVTQEQLDTVTELSLSSSQREFTLKEISNLGLLRNLEKLDLSYHFSFDSKETIDKMWEQIALLKNLREFRLSQPSRDVTNYNDLYIKIPHLPNLENLTLEWWSVMDTQEPYSLAITKVYENTGITKENLPSLKNLNLESTTIDNYEELKGMNLQSLDVSYSNLMDIVFLKNMTTLEDLSIGSNHITDFTPLNNLPNLKKLDAKKQRIYYAKDGKYKYLVGKRVFHRPNSNTLTLPQSIKKADGSNLNRVDFTEGEFNVDGSKDKTFTLDGQGNIIYNNLNFGNLPKFKFWLGDYNKSFTAIPYMSPEPCKNALVNFEFDSGINTLETAAKISGYLLYEVEETNKIHADTINQVPVINANDRELMVGEEFNPLEGVTATDKEDGTIVLNVKDNVVENTVNNKQAGTYTVKYKVTDKKGATVYKTITVVVKDNPSNNPGNGSNGGGNNIGGINPGYTHDKIIGENRYETGSMVADRVKTDKVILVNGSESMADGLSASSLAGKKDATIIPIKHNSIPKYAKKTIEKASEVYIIGEKNAISKEIENSLKNDKVERIGGKNRYETSEKVAEKIGKYDKAYLVNGRVGEADAMSISPVAARDVSPIILTNGNTSDYNKKPGVEYTAIGGKDVITEKLKSKYEASRIGGKDRYETNRKVIQTFYKWRNTRYFCNGETLIDALSASYLARHDGIVLVSKKHNHDLLQNVNTVQVGGMPFEVKFEK